MAAQCGQAIVLSFKNASSVYEVVAGLRTRSLSINKETIDVTNADSTNMWRELLDGACGVLSMEMSGEGVFTDATVDETMRVALFAQAARDCKMLIPDFGEFEGSFQINSFELAGEYNGEVTRSVGLMSAGEITFTAV